MARKERQVVLEDGYRGMRHLGAPRKITPARLWVTRALAVLLFLWTLGQGSVAVETSAGLFGALTGAAVLATLAHTGVFRLLSASAPELPNESTGTGVTSLPTVDTAEARQLKSAGYETVEGIALTEYDELAAAAPFAADRVERIHTAAREQVGDPETARSRLRAHAPGQGRTSEDRPR